MNKLLSFLNIIFLLPLVLSGQENSGSANIIWGDAVDVGAYVILSDDESGIYVHKVIGRGLIITKTSSYLEHYDRQLKMTKSVPLDLKGQNQEMHFEKNLGVDNNEILLLYTSFANKLKSKEIYLQKIDIESLTPNGAPVKIGEFDFPNKFVSKFSVLKVASSNDGSKTMLFYFLSENIKSAKLKIIMYDSKFNQLWEKTVSLPYITEKFIPNGYEVDNYGNVHLLCRANVTAKKGKPQYQYRILSLLKEGSELQEIAIDSQDKFFWDIQIFINKDSDIICYGVYSNKGFETTAGTWLFKANYLRKEIIFNYSYKIGGPNNTDEFMKREPREIIERKDGSLTIITESVKSSTLANMRTIAYKGISVSRFSSAGLLEWDIYVNKEQLCDSDWTWLVSFNHFVVDDKSYFFFNDHPKNRNKDIGESLETYQTVNNYPKTIVVLAKVDKKGNQTREILTELEGAVPDIDAYYQLSDNEYILYDCKKSRFGKITFKE
jgi:hypothetical protein